MTQLSYFLRQALRGMRSSSLIQIAAVSAIAAGLVLVGLAVMVASNVDRLTHGWGRATHLTVYLQAGTREQRVDAIERLLRGRQEVASVTRVSPAEARRRLAQSLGPRGHLLADIEPDFLPASLEVQLAAAATPEQVRPLLGLLGAAREVEEVDYLGRWSDQLGTLMTLARHGALLIALVIGLACVHIIATTIRLGVFARREEIEIQKLVGATDGFVRGPLLIEGALQGVCGALIAGGLLLLLHRWIAPEVQQALDALLSHVEVSFLSAPQLLTGIVGGGLLGLVGSSLAIHRYIRV